MRKTLIILFIASHFCFLNWKCANFKAESILSFTNTVSEENDSLSIEEYTNWYADKKNSLIVKRNIQEVNYALEYLPSEYFQLTQGISETNYNPFLMFRLKIQLPNNVGLLKYPSTQYETNDQKVHYFAFEQQQYITLIADGKTYPCIIYNYENNYGLKNFTEFTIGFSKSTIQSNSFQIQLNDQYFGTGEVNFSMNSSIITQSPKIK